MKIQNRSLVLSGAIALALALTTAPAFATGDSPEISNARMESQIWTTYALNPNLRSNDLEVSVLDGRATLSGVVEEDVSRDLAEQVALGVNGITAVDNQITVEADFQPTARAAGERQYGAKMDDASTSAAVRSKMSWSQRSGNETANVATVDGKVTLKGNAASAEDKAFVTQLALDTPGVRSVDNQMTVDGTAMPMADATLSSTAPTDSWITTKVKSTFMHSSNVNSSSITVNTSAGVVTLGGSVSSDTERARAIELAQNVRGVKSVVSNGLELTGGDEVASLPKAR